MKKFFKFVGGLIVGMLVAGLFGFLAWYVLDEGPWVGYVASALFGIAAVGAGIAGFLWVFLDPDPTESPRPPQQKRKDGQKTHQEPVDTVAMGAAMLVATSDQFDDQSD